MLFSKAAIFSLFLISTTEAIDCFQTGGATATPCDKAVQCCSYVKEEGNAAPVMTCATNEGITGDNKATKCPGTCAGGTCLCPDNGCNENVAGKACFTACKNTDDKGEGGGNGQTSNGTSQASTTTSTAGPTTSTTTKLNPTTHHNETATKNNTEDPGKTKDIKNKDETKNKGGATGSYAEPLVKANLLAMLVPVVPIIFGDVN